jgi:hypothetical protein
MRLREMRSAPKLVNNPSLAIFQHLLRSCPKNNGQLTKPMHASKFIVFRLPFRKIVHKLFLVPIWRRLQIPKLLALACGMLFAAALVEGCFVTQARAVDGEPLPTFKWKLKTYTNAVMVELTAVDLVFYTEASGHMRLKRKSLPPELAAKYPFDEVAAAELQQEKLKRVRSQQAADAELEAATQEASRAKQSRLQDQISDENRRLSTLQRDLDVVNRSARGKPRSQARKEADRLRNEKRGILRGTGQLEDQLNQTRKQADSPR